MKKIIKELIPYIIIIVSVLTFRYFIATPVRVDGDSMNDTLKNGDILILNKLDKTIERFDIVVINVNGKRLIKRVIALPGEYIEYKDNKLYINGKKMKDKALIRTRDFTLKETYDIEFIPKDYYFVMGDNRMNSLDSRRYEVGLINKKDIKGVTTFRLLPFSKLGTLK